MRRRTRDWGFLPDLALHIVVSRLTNPVDFQSFASTCRSWRLFASEVVTRADFLASLPPMLYRPDGDEGSFFGVVEKRGFRFGPRSVSQSPPAIPPGPPFPYSGEVDSRFLCGVSHGYLIFVDHRCFPPYHLFLVDPVSRTEIRGLFPKAPLKRKYFCCKALLTSPPDSPGCVLVLFSGRRDCVRYCRRGDKVWGHIRTRELGSGNSCASLDGSEMWVFCTRSGKLLHIDLAQGLRPKMTFSNVEPISLSNTKASKMTRTSSGELLLVLFDVLHNRHLTKVYQLGKEKWERKESLGNHSLLVDDESCYYLDHPERWGLLSDCIYLHAMNRGVFAFQVNDKKVEQVSAYPETVLRSFNQDYRWIIPCSRRDDAKLSN